MRYVRRPLQTEDLPAGKARTRLALSFDERSFFVLTEKLELKRLAFLDLIQEVAERAAAAGDEQVKAISC